MPVVAYLIFHVALPLVFALVAKADIEIIKLRFQHVSITFRNWLAMLSTEWLYST
jgi:hypothetical protein